MRQTGPSADVPVKIEKNTFEVCLVEDLFVPGGAKEGALQQMSSILRATSLAQSWTPLAKPTMKIQAWVSATRR